MILVIHILISVWIIYISPSKQQRNIVQLCTTPPPDCKISVFYASPYEIGYWNKKWSLTLQRRLSLPFQSFPTGLWLDQGEKQVVLVWFQNLPINTSRLVCIAKWKTLVLCLRGNWRFQAFKIRKYFPHSHGFTLFRIRTPLSRRPWRSKPRTRRWSSGRSASGWARWTATTQASSACE